MRLVGRAAVAMSFAALAACQSAPPTGAPLALQPTPQPSPPASKAAAQAAAVPAGTAKLAASAQATGSVQCAMVIAGPPPKPAKGADFGGAVAKDLGKNVSRNILSGIAGQVAGPLGGAVAGGLAMHAIRPERDLKGAWTATDGAPTCGCTVDVSAGINLQGRTADKGKLSAGGCSSPLLATAVRWTLGHSFTGYDAPLDLFAANGAKVASLKRDGMDYFSGALADGTPVTLWRK